MTARRSVTVEDRLRLTKGSLGESYIVGTGAVLGLVLLGKLAVEGWEPIVWTTIGLTPVCTLVAAVYWLGYLGLDSEQVWTVAEASALAMGLGTCALFGLDVMAPGIGFTSGDTFLVGTSIGTVAVAGALAGVVWELHRSKRRLGLRNEVMHRVLRHNLRNDMTVVLCLLDEIEATTDGESQQHVDRARETIDGLVAMTDKVRQVNVTANSTHTRTEPIDLVGVVENRVRKLRADNPGVEITTDLPAEAPVAVSGEFGIVVDNVVESALSRAAEAPRLHVAVTRERRTVELTFEDHTGAIPEADLFAVAAESETDLEHGFGVELWLVHWLVDANDGELRFETEGETRCIRIELDAPRGGILRL